MGASTASRVHLAERSAVVPRMEPVAGPPRAFHRSMDGYERTRVISLPDVASSLGIGEIWVKDESRRLDLPSFKILGGSWAVHRLLMTRAGRPFESATFADLEEAAAAQRPLTLTTATDGNHGRGVARMARLLGLEAVVFVPDDMVPARIAGIEAENAKVIVNPGDYDAAVARSASEGAANGWAVIADVAYDGYTEVPRWVMDGYDTIFAECDDQIGAAPTALFVQAGVGALAGAAMHHYAASGQDTRFAVVEPLQAACLFESAVQGGPVTLTSSQGSIMAGLNCGTPSTVAWPIITAATNAYIAIPDERTREAMRLLAGAGIEAGESGAAGLAGLLEVASSSSVRERLQLDDRATVLVINTEGATDPEAYQSILRQEQPRREDAPPQLTGPPPTVR